MSWLNKSITLISDRSLLHASHACIFGKKVPGRGSLYFYLREGCHAIHTLLHCQPRCLVQHHFQLLGASQVPGSQGEEVLQRRPTSATMALAVVDVQIDRLGGEGSIGFVPFLGDESNCVGSAQSG